MKSKQTDKTSNQANKPRKRAKPTQFTLLPEEIEQVERLRSRYQKLALAKSDEPADIAKSEIVRAGIAALIKLNDHQFFKLVEDLEVLPRGRPVKQEKEFRPPGRDSLCPYRAALISTMPRPFEFR